MSFLTNSYQEMLGHAASPLENQQVYPLEKFDAFGMQGMALHAQAPIFYVVDYTQKKYLYIDPSCEKFLGEDLNFLREAGPLYYTSLWHPNDFACFNSKIFPEALDFLRNHSVSDYPKFSFSFNYRLNTKTGKYLSILQRSTFYGKFEEKHPAVAIGYIIDITAYKTDILMVHTIEEIASGYSSLSKNLLFKSVHNPDVANCALSKRELEILKAVQEGLSSKMIATRFSISLNTVNNHRKNMLAKTHACNSTELINYAKQHGLL